MNRSFCIILSIVLVLSLFTGCVQQSPPSVPGDGPGTERVDVGKIDTGTVNGNTQFAFDIFRGLSAKDTGENIFISPLSISAALTMAYQGAASTTKDAIAGTLGYSDINKEQLNESYKNLLLYLGQLDKKIELNINNSIWIREGEPIKEDFLTTNRDTFDALVSVLDFTKESAVGRINQWISDATKKKIEKMLDPPIPADVIMYLINAIYFKGDWARQFEKKNTYETEFYKDDGSSNEIMMMSRKGSVEYGQGDGFKSVRLPYGDGKVAMYCVLPEETAAIDSFIESLDIERWQSIKGSISEKDDILLRLPRFKLEYGVKNLNDSLTALGMGVALSENADFSGIREGIFISEVLHKAIIEVNEEGSEAAAVTVVGMSATAVAKPLTFIADRPFVFIIEELETGTILFMGKLCSIE